jgi:dissimilatory sulfite reductase (desulfoviridin) alpha/beta subunit
VRHCKEAAVEERRVDDATGDAVAEACDEEAVSFDAAVVAVVEACACGECLRVLQLLLAAKPSERVLQAVLLSRRVVQRSSYLLCLLLLECKRWDDCRLEEVLLDMVEMCFVPVVT